MSDSSRRSGQTDRRKTFVLDVLTALGLIVLFMVAAVILWSAAEIFLLAFAGLLLGVFLATPARFLSNRTTLPHGGGLAITVGVLMVLVVGAGWLMGPQIGEQVGELLESIPTSLQQVRDMVRDWPGGATLLDRMGGQDSSGSSLNLVSRATGTAWLIWDVLAKLVYVVFLGLFLASAPRKYRDGMVRLFPAPHQTRAREVLDEVGRTVQGWLLGQLFSMVVIGVITGVGLWIIGIPLALILGIIAGLSEFVPIVGPFLGFIPAALLALTQGTSQVLWVLGLYIVIQQLEGNVIMPLVQQRTVDLPPAIAITAVFVAAAMFGLPGLLVATPLAAVGVALVRTLYLGDVLDQAVTLPGESET